jgi:hypothetical protein
MMEIAVPGSSPGAGPGPHKRGVPGARQRSMSRGNLGVNGLPSEMPFEPACRSHALR